MVNSKCYLFVLFNISSSYHIRVIDVRSYNKDSYRITSHQPSTPCVQEYNQHCLPSIFRYLTLVPINMCIWSHCDQCGHVLTTVLCRSSCLVVLLVWKSGGCLWSYAVATQPLGQWNSHCQLNDLSWYGGEGGKVFHQIPAFVVSWSSARE